MELQTKVELDKKAVRFGYHSRLMMMGSCFVENMGEKLEKLRFQVDINPCGIVYNPLSVADSLDILLSGRHFSATDLLWNKDRWVSLHHHGCFSARSQDECLQQINARIDEGTACLKNADMLVITWGTSWVYHYRANGKVVANCHKFPSADFERRRLSVDEIVFTYTDIIARLREMNSEIRVVFTVSPIRHWKDGAHGNQLSKAVLLLAIDELVRQVEGVSYFPSYEIVMDELRDYRFYAEDMLHLSPQAVEYIWEKFKSVYIASEAEALMKQVDQINKTLAHRPSEPGSEETLRLAQQMHAELQEIDCRIKALARR